VPYFGHPGYHKTITTVRGQYFWPGMKKYVTDYLARCMECQKVKAEHKASIGIVVAISHS
jgi:hypothetical protein